MKVLAFIGIMTVLVLLMLLAVALWHWLDKKHPKILIVFLAILLIVDFLSMAVNIYQRL